MENKETKLPSTRVEQLFYSLKFYFGNVSFASYMTFIFAIPLALYAFFFCYQWIAMLNTPDVTKESIMIFGSLYLLPVIPLTGLLGIGLSGAYKMMIRITSDQPCNASNYFSGIKENWWQFLIYFLILGLGSYFVIFNFFFFSPKENNLLFVIIRFLSLIVFCFLLNIVTCASVEQVKYNMKVRDILRNAFILSFKKTLPTFGLIILTIAPLSLVFFFSRVVKVIILAALFLFYFGLSSLIIVLRYQYIFDEIIHKENRPEEYHRGLSSFGGHKE